MLSDGDAAPQETTDLHKCLLLALAHPLCGARRRCVLLGALGGRMDHTLAALSTLHAFPGESLTLLDERNAVTLLQPGTHSLRLCRRREGPVCGLVPLCGPATVTTAGLRWDLSATRLAMGELVRCAACSRRLVPHSCWMPAGEHL